jgi:hypothetical protein
MIFKQQQQQQETKHTKVKNLKPFQMQNKNISI